MASDNLATPKHKQTPDITQQNPTNYMTFQTQQDTKHRPSEEEVMYPPGQTMKSTLRRGELSTKGQPSFHKRRQSCDLNAAAGRTHPVSPVTKVYGLTDSEISREQLKARSPAETELHGNDITWSRCGRE